MDLTVRAKFTGNEVLRGLKNGTIYMVNIGKYGSIYHVTEKPSIFFDDQKIFAIYYKNKKDMNSEWQVLEIV